MRAGGPVSLQGNSWSVASGQPACRRGVASVAGLHSRYPGLHHAIVGMRRRYCEARRTGRGRMCRRAVSRCGRSRRWRGRTYASAPVLTRPAATPHGAQQCHEQLEWRRSVRAGPAPTAGTRSAGVPSPRSRSGRGRLGLRRHAGRVRARSVRPYLSPADVQACVVNERNPAQLGCALAGSCSAGSGSRSVIRENSDRCSPRSQC